MGTIITPPPPTRGTCRTCGGRIYRPELVPGHPHRRWLHAYPEHWQGNPHHALPA